MRLPPTTPAPSLEDQERIAARISHQLAGERIAPRRVLAWAELAYIAGWDPFVLEELIREAQRIAYLLPALAGTRGASSAVLEPLNARDGSRATVTPSTRPGVRYQVTRFDSSGAPMGHYDSHGGLRETLERAWRRVGPYRLVEAVKPGQERRANPWPHAAELARLQARHGDADGLERFATWIQGMCGDGALDTPQRWALGAKAERREAERLAVLGSIRGEALTVSQIASQSGVDKRRVRAVLKGAAGVVNGKRKRVNTYRLGAGQSDYAERQEARRDRLRERAAKKRAKAAERYEASKQGLPEFGEPIKVGHHSESKHRKDLERSFKAMGASIQAAGAAKDLERRAEAVGRAISSDDPLALEKLHKKLASVEEEIKGFKAANKVIRATLARIGAPSKKGDLANRATKLAIAEALTASEVPRSAIEAVQRSAIATTLVPYASTTNLSANKRRILARIKELEEEGVRRWKQETYDAPPGIEAGEDLGQNRVQIRFVTTPTKEEVAELKSILKKWGFRWARYSGVWERKLNEAGRVSMKRALEELRAVTRQANPRPGVAEALERYAAQLGKPGRVRKHGRRYFWDGGDPRGPLLLGSSKREARATLRAFAAQHNPPLAIVNPGRSPRRRKRSARKNPGKGFSVRRMDVAAAESLAGFQEAFARYVELHGVEPDEVVITRVPNGSSRLVRKVMVGVGRTPETHYVTSEAESNKAGPHWVHEHPEGKEPILALDPSTKGVMVSIPQHSRARVTDWLRE